MKKYIDAEELIAKIGELRKELPNTIEHLNDEESGFARGQQYELTAIEAEILCLQQEHPETDMKSPFTGGNVAILSRQEEVTFRGEKVKILRKYYRCEDTGREFTDSKLDEDMMWTAFRAYCEKKGMTSFTDIMLKQEQPEVDLEKEITEHAENMPHGEFTHDSECREHEEWAMKEFRHFYELGRARKEE